MLVGPTNNDKSFLLNLLELMFKCFVKPAKGKYAWVGLDECRVAYLNYFRWSAELIGWDDFLLLLEGQTMHLLRPKFNFPLTWSLIVITLCLSLKEALSQ